MNQVRVDADELDVLAKPIKVHVQGFIWLSITLYFVILCVYFPSIELRLLLGLVVSVQLLALFTVFRPLPQMTLLRRLPYGKYAGEAFYYHLDIEMEGRQWFTRKIFIRDCLKQKRGLFKSNQASFIMMAGEKEKKLSLHLNMKAPARGDALFPRIEFELSFIPALYSRVYEVCLENECLIFPERLQMDFAHLDAFMGEDGADAEYKLSFAKVMEGEFEGVREYRHGDSLKYVDWKRRCRDKRQWWIKNYQQQIPKSITIILDPQSGKLPSRQSMWQLDQSLSYLLALCGHLLSIHTSVHFMTVRNEIEQFDLSDPAKDIQRLNLYCASFQPGKRKLSEKDIKKVSIRQGTRVVIIYAHEDSSLKFKTHDQWLAIGPEEILKYRKNVRGLE